MTFSVVIAQDSSLCCPYGQTRSSALASFSPSAASIKLAHPLFVERLARRLAVQQVDHDLAKGRKFRKDYLHLRSWSGTSHRVEQCLAAPLAQRLSSPGRRLLTLRILRLAELGPQR